MINNQHVRGDQSDRFWTWLSLVLDPGSSGRLNLFWDPMAAGKGGAENMAATTLMRVIHDCICSAFLWTESIYTWTTSLPVCFTVFTLTTMVV